MHKYEQEEIEEKEENFITKAWCTQEAVSPAVALPKAEAVT